MIRVTGASEHNLRDVDAVFGDGLTVVTGVSGSGKTSLVFDTLYHEARRRFLEIFALGSSSLRMAPANVRSIEGLGRPSPWARTCSTAIPAPPGHGLRAAPVFAPVVRPLRRRATARGAARR